MLQWVNHDCSNNHYNSKWHNSDQQGKLGNLLNGFYQRLFNSDACEEILFLPLNFSYVSDIWNCGNYLRNMRTANSPKQASAKKAAMKSRKEPEPPYQVLWWFPPLLSWSCEIINFLTYKSLDECFLQFVVESKPQMVYQVSKA